MRIIAPGRVNLIGEHIDYHSLPVLPMALRRSIKVDFHPAPSKRIRADSPKFGRREFEWSPNLEPVASGDWENYLRAAANVVQRMRPGKQMVGIDAVVSSDLPAAAGLSSSSALLVAFTLALLQANKIETAFEELMEVLPDGEHFVGTRGGGMDHAASLASREGCASLIGFDPVSIRHVPVPAHWSFLVAHSMTTAEKSGASRDEYNARRIAGNLAPAKLGFTSYREALAAHDSEGRLDLGAERDSFLHITEESRRVADSVEAMESGDAPRFGKRMQESHASLRDLLRVSSPALDRLVETAMQAGALGARLTGAGFGGCAVILCAKEKRDQMRAHLIDHYFSTHPTFDENHHLIDADAGPGALATPPSP
jgi:galactokinase